MIDVFLYFGIDSEKDLSDITSILNVEPSVQCNAESLVFRTLGLQAQRRSWTLKEQLVNNGVKQMTIDDFFKKYPSILEKKNLLSQMGKMRIRLSIISLYGQFLYHLTPQETEVLSVLNIPVEISVFSYGKCEE